MFRSLRTRKGRRDTGLFLVEGVRLCEELLRSEVPAETLLLAAQEAKVGGIAELARKFRASGAEVLEALTRDVQMISDTVHSQGIIAVARWKDLCPGELHFETRAVVLALDRVSDPGNVGTIIRTAAWFGASGVLLGEGCADLLNPKTVRATMGGIFHLPVCRHVVLSEALAQFTKLGFSINVAATDGDTDWPSWAASPRSLLILGSEAHGVHPGLKQQADRILSIPKPGHGDSLNVAACAGIFLSARADSTNGC